MLVRSLTDLIGIRKDAADRLREWIRNDIWCFVARGFDFGLAYAAARAGWRHFNEEGFNVGAQRARWLNRAKEIDEERTKATYMDDTGQELIKSPYLIMPRRIWDLKSSRVVEFGMLHAEIQSTEVPRSATVTNPGTASILYPTFWAVSHSWTSNMETVETPINQYQWPVPLPNGIDLEHVRQELLSFGADYVWLDVLCLRQRSDAPGQSPNLHSSLEALKQDEEWKIDVPTIGNIYRAAAQLVRYFNGLGAPFSKHGWDDPRHWLRRAWTLQEIGAENRTFNGGVSHDNGRIILNTKGTVAGKVTTLRKAIRPVLKLAADVDSPGGCTVYELAREMATRCASQPTDKVAGLFYLLRTIQLPAYNQRISDETAWRQCFHVLPFGRKIEILFDFPYRGTEQQWFPTWRQMMEWPERDPDYEHAPAKWPENRKTPELIQSERNIKDKPWLFVSGMWAISHVLLSELSEQNEYEVEIGSKVLGFYFPYLSEAHIKIHKKRFTLAVLNSEHIYNWVVFEEVETQNGQYRSEDGKQKIGEIEVLKKVGILRTDSSSELLVGGENDGPLMKKINALFV
ncbi:hypothetical protein BDZ91DRAFT_786860 [Kalaharituber pfeilii]|nr:hypothetical protein BDZ91DRAFT_786860 [Kalaharituber pfeilii]